MQEQASGVDGAGRGVSMQKVVPPMTSALVAFGVVAMMAAAIVVGVGSPSADATSLHEARRLLPTAPDEYNADGTAIGVATDGDTAFLGGTNGTNTGAAFVLERNAGGTDNWGLVKELTASDAEDFDRFGASLAIDGDTLVVGAYYEDTAGLNGGAAYVYQRDEGGADNWGEVVKLTASDGDHSQWFGHDVSLSGDVAIVGAYGDASEGSDTGAAYIFYRDEGGADNWGEVAKLTASDAEAGGQFRLQRLTER